MQTPSASLPSVYTKSRTAEWKDRAALFLVAACWLLDCWYIAATRTARTRRDTAFRIFCWLEVLEFSLFFLFLFLGLTLHVTFHLFVVRAFVDRRPRRRTPCNILLVIADRCSVGLFSWSCVLTFWICTACSLTVAVRTA